VSEQHERFFADLKTLSASHAQHYDAARFAYLESMATRLQQDHYSSNKRLISKALDSLQAYQQDLEKQQAQADKWRQSVIDADPESAELANDLFERCQYRSLKLLHDKLTMRSARQSQLNGLKALVKQIDQTNVDGHQTGASPSIDDLLAEHNISAYENIPTEDAISDSKNKPLEMQSTRQFRESMKYFDIDKLIEQAITDLPQNPGPHNPQMLAINALAQMRKLSPQYLRRFASYVETLRWLEKNSAKLTNQKAPS